MTFTTPEGVTWVALEGLIPKGAPAMPLPVSGLRLGMPAAEARAVLAAARDPRLDPPPEQRVGDRQVVGSTLGEFPEVGVTLILDVRTELLAEVDVSLPTDQALFVFSDAWGEPRMEARPEVGPVAVWDHPVDPLRVEVTHAPRKLSIARYLTRP